MKVILRILLLMVGCSMSMQAQLAVKSNVLYDATLSPNIGIELGLAPRWSVELTGNLNAWTLNDGMRWKHWFVQPEARYWFCDRFSGHFVGAHLLGGQYNVGGIRHLHHDFLGLQLSRLGDSRFQGWFLGAGIAYGYTWILSRRWSIEAEIGLGYVYRCYDVYPCAHCGTKIEEIKSRSYVGPTKAALNLIYVF